MSLISVLYLSPIFAQTASQAPAASSARNDARILLQSDKDEATSIGRNPIVVWELRFRVALQMAAGQSGQSEANAIDILKTVVVPEYLRRLPELDVIHENILVDVFTSEQLRMMVAKSRKGTSGFSREDFIELGPRFQESVQRYSVGDENWGNKVGHDILAANKDIFHDIGFDDPTLKPKFKQLKLDIFDGNVP